MSTLILTVRQCSFCSKRYQLGPTERAMIEKNPAFAPVHTDCLEKWKQLPPHERIARYAREEAHARTKWT